MSWQEFQLIFWKNEFPKHGEPYIKVNDGRLKNDRVIIRLGQNGEVDIESKPEPHVSEVQRYTPVLTLLDVYNILGFPVVQVSLLENYKDIAANILNRIEKYIRNAKRDEGFILMPIRRIDDLRAPNELETRTLPAKREVISMDSRRRLTRQVVKQSATPGQFSFS